MRTHPQSPEQQKFSKLLKLSELSFDNRFVEQLPADTQERNFVRQVANASYSKVEPAQVSNPSLVACSEPLAREIGLLPTECQTDTFLQVFSGNQLLPAMQPYAMCYGGHQFGHWAGQLGDGRAINLGELRTEQGKHWTLQLKGAGPTPYSRTADGLAVLRSSIREFLCSEAMHYLGVPTTRALSLALTGEQVERDMFYDGRPAFEPGAIVCRVAPSFIRFGNFELPSLRNEHDTLRQIADFTIHADFPELAARHAVKSSDESPTALYVDWFNEVCQRTATLMVHWMRVGFVHGVMNTDNMSILGLTIDYGPYGWLDNYDPEWTPNTTDLPGKRYCYGQQPQIGLWNLHRLALAIHPLIGESEGLEQALADYQTAYQSQWDQMMAEKLGMQKFHEDDRSLMMELSDILRLVETDMTLFYRRLADLSDGDDSRFFADVLYTDVEHPEHQQRLNAWLQRYRLRLQKEGVDVAERRSNMNSVNPLYVPRNYLAQMAIERATEGDFSMVSELQQAFLNPYQEQEKYLKFAQKRPQWARQKPGCSMLSCSS